MSWYFPFALLIAGVAAIAPQGQAGQPGGSPLYVGESFPRISGQTLTNKQLNLPAAAIGKPAFVVFSFSKAAGKDARLWNERLLKDYSESNVVDAPGYQVIVLERVPRLIRSIVVSSMKNNMPPAVQERTIVSYQDEALWRQRLAVSDDNRAYIFLLDREGRLRWNNSAAFTDSEYAHLKDELRKLLQPNS
jgi:ATP10 protein